MSCPFLSGSGVEKPSKHFTYQTYLQLDKITKAQKLVSNVVDEHLFIVIHQAYEIWFCQILFDLDHVHELLEKCSFGDASLEDIVKRLQRIKLIFAHNLEKIAILETMTPLDFMEFRGQLGSASGFQSLQFRLIENKLGLEDEDRVDFAKNYLNDFIDDEEALEALRKAKIRPLNKILQEFLEKTPGIETDGFNFWGKFKKTVEIMLDKQEAEAEKIQDESDRKSALERIAGRRKTYDTIFDEKIHNKMVVDRIRKFSYKALQGAMFVACYRDEPKFSLPFQIMQLLMDVDSTLMTWRYRHSLMVQRMIGTNQIGTGGSSGFGYLSETTSDRYKIFLDLTNLSCFMIPKDILPPLDDEMKKKLKNHSRSYISCLVD